jgi:Ni,Fe-hydrogenase III large subunit
MPRNEAGPEKPQETRSSLRPVSASRSLHIKDLARKNSQTWSPVIGKGLHQIPVGPVHAGIIEPGHFRFTANGETVARLEERLGYVHKGADGLLTDVALGKAGRVVARLSGDSTVAFSFAFARAVEAALDVQVPPRAQALRGVMAELERISNHFGDVGAICNDAAFALIHAYCGILREKVLAACDRAFGHRLMMDAIVPGGVAEDIGAEGPSTLIKMLDDVSPRFAEVVRVYDGTPSLQDRTCGTGVVAPALVKQ